MTKRQKKIKWLLYLYHALENYDQAAMYRSTGTYNIFELYLNRHIFIYSRNDILDLIVKVKRS